VYDYTVALDAVSGKRKDFYQKTDGSLDDGVEIVYHPRSVLSWKEYLPNLADVAKVAAKYDFRAHDTDTCGLHIHISRAGIRQYNQHGDLDSAIDRLIYLYEKNYKGMLTFSRRKDASLTRWAGRVLEAGEKVELKKIKDKKGEDRYKAINIQPDHTVEFRFFKGTLNPETVLAAVQLADNMVKIACGTPDSKIGDVDMTQIIQYNPEYTEIISYAASRGL
jgi:hypothetical protein